MRSGKQVSRFKPATAKMKLASTLERKELLFALLTRREACLREAGFLRGQRTGAAEAAALESALEKYRKAHEEATRQGVTAPESVSSGGELEPFFLTPSLENQRAVLAFLAGKTNV